MQDERTGRPPSGDFCRRAAQRRRELGLTREEVAQRAGMAPGYVAYLEEHPPLLTRRSLHRLAQALSTSPDHLLGADTEAPPGAGGTVLPRPELRTLTRRECDELIAPGGVGRFAFAPHGGGPPTVLPVNYAVVRGDVVFRTGAEGVIAAHLPGRASFEVDRIDDAVNEGWSVLLTGRALPVRDARDVLRLRGLTPVRPWAGGEREAYVRMVPEKVTGRRIVPAEPQPGTAPPFPRAGEGPVPAP
ncbi:helix-turn-helix domain-containing protein [Nocardiopsis potens]|uniref:helix-turn-helix domain-containing protein n=1 Tax=Nocardiopsis potens TaxID=1246458 RepID=UPI00034BE98D|nr:pyridoxamine 5'-phosphate oxidase family protein [Nocardiopsis potens]